MEKAKRFQDLVPRVGVDLLDDYEFLFPDKKFEKIKSSVFSVHFKTSYRQIRLSHFQKYFCFLFNQPLSIFQSFHLLKILQSVSLFQMIKSFS